MSVTLPSDEVAEDYKHALEDLITNDRYQINNLTMIAKENIEHGEAIARVLSNHIKKAPPSRKLPALYVLDSLVKNIQSPYTLYLGRDLYNIFMSAYVSVGEPIRRKFEETLKTWREPVPGSLSTTPVFPLQTTQSIVDALNKHKAASGAASGRSQQHLPPNSRQLPSQYRNTPTPPQGHLPIHSLYPSLASQTQISQNTSFASSQMPIYAQTPTPQPQARPVTRSSVNVEKLNNDIDDLTTDAKIECATHPMDSNAQRKLATLQTLKELLDAGNASEQDLIDINNTISQEMAKRVASQDQRPAQPATPVIPQYLSQQPQSHYPQPPAPPVQIPTPSFLNSTNLAELLRVTAPAQPTPPQTHAYPAAFPPPPPLPAYSTPPVVHSHAASVPSPTTNAPPAIPASALPLIEQLRASGLLPGTPAAAEVKTPPMSLASLFGAPAVEVSFTSASIRIPRPQTILKFLDEKPNQCSTCGRRFASDDVGREKKARHLDWHFKTKARMADAEKRGQNRSWYVDEREWIANKEFDDDVTDDPAATNGLSPASTIKKQPQDFVRAPTDPTLRNAPCPIDQEPFRSEWSEEVQDFIWKDAIKVGNRYYHASCYKEATKDRDKDGGMTPQGAGTTRTATPDSVLGKRKAQQDIEASTRSRVKVEA